MDFPMTVTTPSYECIVCHRVSKTLSDHHRHQTYSHTSEELSICTIGLRSSLMNKARATEGWIHVRTWLCDPRQLSRMYAYSSELLQNDPRSANYERTVPLDYVIPKQDFSEESSYDTDFPPPRRTVSKTKVKKRAKPRSRASNSEVLDLSCKFPRRKKQTKAAKAFEVKQEMLRVKEETESEAILETKEKDSAEILEIKETPEPAEKTLTEEASISEIRSKCQESQERIERSKDLGRKENHSSDVKNTHQALAKKIPIQSAKKQISVLKCRDKSVSTVLKTPSPRDESEIIEIIVLDTDENNIEKEENDGNSIEKEKNDEQKAKKINATKKKTYSRKPKNKISPKKDAQTLKIWSEDKIFDERFTLNKEINKQSDDDLITNYPTLYERLMESVTFNNGENQFAETNDEISDPQDEIFNDGTRCDVPENDSNVDRGNSDAMCESFDRVETFPQYPQNMDERTILVFDTDVRKLVWTSFKLIENTPFDNEDINGLSETLDSPFLVESDAEECLVNEDFAISPMPIKLEEDEALNEESISQIETNETIKEEDNLPEIDIPRRPKRTRMTPNRFVPY